jgi:hypothetical protein
MGTRLFKSVYILMIIVFAGCNSIDPRIISECEKNAEQANEGFIRCRDFVNGWLEYADSSTGLIPRNLTSGINIWNAQDAAADNYPFMVLTASLVDRDMFEGRMKDMLDTETRLTSRVGAMPDTWSFVKQDFESDEINMNGMMFGSSEYIKDGLLPLTEWLGESPWSDRMISILDDMWENASVETDYGKIVSENMEVNGEMLQSLSRIYWMTGNQNYLEYAIRLGDYYLLGDHHPTRDFEYLKLRDHGCEIISGLCELYATVNFADQDKKSEYKKPVYELLDRILEVGRNEDGLFYNSINPKTGEIVDKRISDGFGYNLNGFYTVYLIDGKVEYREATVKTLGALKDNYENFLWEGSSGTGSADGYADAIEGALNLYNREPVPSCADWADSEIKVMWEKQQDSGIIEGWHGDGNFARTTLIYCLWKTQGISIDPWREDVKFGAVYEDNKLYLRISADSDWEGRIIFDKPRHNTNFNLPVDWPRINQMPEWFTVEKDRDYKIRIKEKRERMRGEKLTSGIEISINQGEEIIVII